MKTKEKCKDIWQGDFLSNQTDGVRRSFLKEAHTHKRKQLGTTSQKYFTFKMEICPVSGTIQIQCSRYKPFIKKGLISYPNLVLNFSLHSNVEISKKGSLVNFSISKLSNFTLIVQNWKPVF